MKKHIQTILTILTLSMMLLVIYACISIGNSPIVATDTKPLFKIFVPLILAVIFIGLKTFFKI